MALNTDCPFYPTGGAKRSFLKKKEIKLSGNPIFVGFFLSRDVFRGSYCIAHNQEQFPDSMNK